MSAKFPFAVRRRFMELPEAKADEMIEASQRSWKPCVYVLLASLYVTPVLLFLVGVAVGWMLAPLPWLSAGLYLAGLMLLIWLTPKVVSRVVKPKAFKRIRAAGFNYFCGITGYSINRKR
ncbi:hypothetical protein [Dyella telluris]|uniref:Uncharacterized protein n=1 Tax=Dyella telluris TaxID=2763498 RepID=A0A7G8Q3J4_9GAMM|nr:hypothetical protein [Dyella telluris]QNK01352.1 hypothetical protein H8F01_20305 [Dyella telluris]